MADHIEENFFQIPLHAEHRCLRYIYIYNLPLKPFSKYYYLTSHTTYVVYVNFIHKWRDLQFKVDSNDRFLRNFSWQFYLLSEFLPEICSRLHIQNLLNFFFFFVFFFKFKQIIQQPIFHFWRCICLEIVSIIFLFTLYAAMDV